MNDHQKVQFKNKLKQDCIDMIVQRIGNTRIAIADAQQSANNEEKSSAGDKYETSRAMGHLEKDMHARQLAAHLKELSDLHAVDTDKLYTTAVRGAFITCSSLSLFIAVGLGKQIIGGEPVLLLSPYAPMAKLLAQKKAGDHFLVNGKDTEIIEVF